MASEKPSHQTATLERTLGLRDLILLIIGSRRGCREKSFLTSHSHRGFSPVIPQRAETSNRFNGFSFRKFYACGEGELVASDHFGRKVLARKCVAAKETVKTVRCFLSGPAHRAKATV
jgi:hypothetical protein